MAFSQRMAALTAVVAIPLGVAATSYALTDDPEEPTPPARVELENTTSPPGSAPSSPTGTPSDEVVSPPPVRDGPTADPTGSPGDDSDDTGDDSGGGPGDDDADD
ncbi:hypothetical protein [Streptomyces sp. MAR4 CNX-425]|uniref:hypothetical protein n=1 Tax=Streptomyces sp. MAR4 CNX-425 TaxID=3406343 RepID=UPI003B500882